MKRAEDILQANIVTYLRLALPKAIVFAIPNGGQRSIQEAVMLKATGLLAGIPDLGLVIEGGIIYFLEVKDVKGRHSPAQQSMATTMLAMGIPYATVRSLADVQAVLHEWKLQ